MPVLPKKSPLQFGDQSGDISMSIIIGSSSFLRETGVIRLLHLESAGRSLFAALPARYPLHAQNDLVSLGPVDHSHLVINSRIKHPSAKVPHRSRSDGADLFRRMLQGHAVNLRACDLANSLYAIHEFLLCSSRVNRFSFAFRHWHMFVSIQDCWDNRPAHV
jgi:hypothetical protein